MAKAQSRRKSIRLQGFDYAQAGAYFVTVCTHGKAPLLGELVGGTIRLNALGEIVRDEWLRTLEIRPQCRLDDFIVMSDHFHAILVMTTRRGVLQYAPTRPTQGESQLRFASPSQTIGAVIRGWKRAVTKRINLLRGTPGEPIWQRGYNDHVIRNDADMLEKRRYIRENPLRWSLNGSKE